MGSFIFSLVLSIVVTATTATSATPTVSIDAGILQGGQCTGSSKAVFFKSIPYAQPLTRNLRFAQPQAYNGPYPNGTLQATSPPPACIQFGTLFAETAATSEDW